MRVALATTAVLFLSLLAPAQDASPANQVGKFAFLQVDARKKVITVECEALDCRAPLEFFCCSNGTNEHESVLRSKVKPSHLHAALLMCGLKPGEPVHFSEAKNAWLPPHGPPLQIVARFEKNGKELEVPAYRLMRDIKSKREMPPMTWIFAGSRVMDNGMYAADQTGYIISIVNFDLTLIDVPKLASNANETLEWETNRDLMPPAGSKVILVITPAGRVDAPTTQAAEPSGPVDQALIRVDAKGNITLNDVRVESFEDLGLKLQRRESPVQRVRVAVANAIEDNPAARDVMNVLSRAGIKFLTIPQAEMGSTTRPTDAAVTVTADDALIRRLRDKWEQSVAPRGQALRDAASTHYQVISQLRSEQQRLIDEADRIQRLIDELEKRYQDMTTPQPATQPNQSQ